MKIKDYTVGTAKGTDLVTVSDGDTGETKNLTLDQIVEATGINGTWTELATDISSAELLALNASPIEILPAPGIGKYYEYKARLEYLFGNTAYTTSGGGAPYLAQGAKDCYFDKTLLEQEADGVSFGTFYAYGLTNTALTLTADSDPTVGDGTARLVITYTTRTIGQ
jgi:hypothetical protein